MNRKMLILPLLFFMGMALAFGIFKSYAGNQSSSWPPAGTKAGSEVRILMKGESLLPEFVNPDTGLFYDNTTAVCTLVSQRFSCDVTSPSSYVTSRIYVSLSGDLSLS